MPNLPPNFKQKAKPKHRWASYQKEKGNRHQRGYGYQWVKLRAQILKRDNYLCQSCLSKDILTEGNTVDHIKPKAHGGTDAPENLQTLCVSCHKRKTAREHKTTGGGL